MSDALIGVALLAGYVAGLAIITSGLWTRSSWVKPFPPFEQETKP